MRELSQTQSIDTTHCNKQTNRVISPPGYSAKLEHITLRTGEATIDLFACPAWKIEFALTPKPSLNRQIELKNGIKISAHLPLQPFIPPAYLWSVKLINLRGIEQQHIDLLQAFGVDSIRQLANLVGDRMSQVIERADSIRPLEWRARSRMLCSVRIPPFPRDYPKGVTLMNILETAWNEAEPRSYHILRPLAETLFTVVHASVLEAISAEFLYFHLHHFTPEDKESP